MRVKIDQNGSELSIAMRVRVKGQEEITTGRFRVGSDDNRNEIHGAPMKSAASWDGTALAIDSVATFGNQELHLNDRWLLSPDKQTLTFKERHQFAAEPAGEETVVFEKQAGATWEPPHKAKPAEEVYKNIQAMKGMPAPRLMPTMMFFTRSLGVECTYCHTPSEFEKDDKPAKITARRMVAMAHQINEASFSNGQAVTCWTCHRGNVKPETAPK